MRIFYVLNNRWPTTKAHGLQVAKTCEALTVEGAEVTLIVPSRCPSRESRNRDPFDFYGIKTRFSVVRLWSPDWVADGLIGKILFMLQQSLFSIRAAMFLARSPGVVYSRDPFSLFVLSCILRRSLFWEVHNWPKNPSIPLRFLVRRLDGVVAITHGVARLARELGMESRRVVVIPDGIDIAEFNIPQTVLESKILLGLDPTKFHVIYTGHLLPWKGVDTLISAAALLDDRFVITIVGGSEAEYRKFRNRDGAGNIRFVPFQSHDHIPLWLRASDVAILPNRRDSGISEFYTSPLKMFEYMASGTCIIASDLPSLREVLSESNAVLIPPDDPPALARAIVSISENRSMAADLTQQARKDVLRYTWVNRARDILAVIRVFHA